MSQPIVTFRADAKIHTYSPGRVYTEPLTPLLEAMLRKGEQLILIDPIDIDAAIKAAAKPVEPVRPPVLVKVEDKPKYVAPAAPARKDNEKSDEDKE